MVPSWDGARCGVRGCSARSRHVLAGGRAEAWLPGEAARAPPGVEVRALAGAADRARAMAAGPERAEAPISRQSFKRARLSAIFTRRVAALAAPTTAPSSAWC